MTKRPGKIENLQEKIKNCIESDNFTMTTHALIRHNERMINISEILYVLKNGYEEKKKTSFDEKHNTWKYAIRGKTKIDKLDIRIIVSFDKFSNAYHNCNVCWRFMKKNRKIKTFIFKGFGFPVRLVNAPLKKVHGEWVFDFSLGILQKIVLHMIAVKPIPLTGKELRFIIDYFEMSYRDFAKIFGISHVAVVKWEKELSRMNPSTEIYLRLYILNHLKVSDKEFRKSYLKIIPENLANYDFKQTPLEIDADKIAC